MKTTRTIVSSTVTLARTALLASAIFLLCVSCTVAAAQQTAAPANEVRFPVAHAHTASWCMGYLYLSPDSIRYEVIRPDKDKKHSFRISRSDITAVQQWILLGTPEKATEIKTAHTCTTSGGCRTRTTYNLGGHHFLTHETRLTLAH